MAAPARRILLTGATGFVGGRLLERLLDDGREVRCLARSPKKLGRHGDRVEVVAGDLRDRKAVRAALQGVDAAVYLVHAMGEGGSFAEEDRRMAAAFGEEARAAGVGRIVYLGGLGDGEALSPHLASRQEVGRVLAEGGVPTFELRAGIVLGCGSLSFEMIRALVERLPVMVAPRWVSTRTQPIGIEEALDALVAALDAPAERAGVIEIGCREAVSYGDLMREYARQRGLRRWILPVPVLTPRLSSLWLGLVTPFQARVGRSLVDSLRNETVVRDPRPAQRLGVPERSVAEAMRDELRREREAVLTHDAAEEGNPVYVHERREIPVSAPPATAFAPVRRIGGATGWYAFPFLWRLRGALDRLLGGPGMARGRRDPERLVAGDFVDCWRVERHEEDRLLLLRAEMRLPGEGWLRFEALPGDGSTSLRQTVIYLPRGLLGRLYWFALLPLHALVFRGMLNGIAAAVPKEDRGGKGGDGTGAPSPRN